MSQPTAQDRSRRGTRVVIGGILAAAVVAGGAVGVATGLYGPPTDRTPIAGTPAPGGSTSPGGSTDPAPSSSGTSASDPSPSASSPSASAPGSPSASAPVVPASALLTEDDVNGGRGPSGDSWVIDTAPPQRESCLDELLPTLEPAATGRVDFQLAEARNTDVSMTTRTLQYTDPQAASAAWKKLEDFGETCRAWADDAGLTDQLKVGDVIAVEGDDDMRYVVVSYVDPEERTDDPGDVGLWRSYGVTLSGDRIGVVETVYRTQEFLFEDSEAQADDTGLPLNPMWRTLPAYQDRLAA